MALIHEKLTENIIGAAVEVHKTLGPGLIESVYETCLCHELTVRGIRFTRQVPLSVRYKDVLLDAGYRIDLMIEDLVVVELKSIESLQPIHEAQLMTYLRLSQRQIGLLINFNVTVLKNGIIRRAL